MFAEKIQLGWNSKWAEAFEREKLKSNYSVSSVDQAFPIASKKLIVANSS